MECGIQSAMLSVPPVADAGVQQPLPASFSPSDTDQAQFEADKRAVYKHPLFPLLALLFERCELATQSSDPQSSDAFNLDIQAFVQHQERDRKPFLANEQEIDGLASSILDTGLHHDERVVEKLKIVDIKIRRMDKTYLSKIRDLSKKYPNLNFPARSGDVRPAPLCTVEEDSLMRMLDFFLGVPMIKAIQVLRIHLLELEKVQELCKDFCNRYITCLKGKMQSENLLRSDYPQGTGLLNNMESNNNTMMSHGNSESGSASNSPVQYSISPPQAVVPPAPNNIIDRQMETPPSYPLPHYGGPTPPLPQTQPPAENMVVHGSTPLSQIGANICPVPPSDSSGPLSPAPTTPGGSADDCDSDFTTRGGRKQKRGVLPKHATSVMRSWLFQHLVHPYPTEDEKRHIAAQTNLTLLQVNNWFINARRRILQPMLDASAPTENSSTASSPSHKKKKSQNNNRRFWPQDFANMQPQLESGMLSSSDDEGDSYSSDGEEGSLVIDSNAQSGEVNQNGHSVDMLGYNNSPEAEKQ